MAARHGNDGAVHRPFAVLDEWIRSGRLRVSDPDVPVTASAEPSAGAAEGELFRAAMRGVRPLDRNAASAPSKARAGVRPGGGDRDAVRVLEEFCRNGTVAPEHTREYVEHAADAAGRRYIADLRSGRFAIQAHLDLHGMTVDAARRVVDVFLRESARAGYSAVRIIHGRGRHSERGRPLLKEHVERWLRHRRLARFVMAFTSARAVDGGGGAVYVLLRRR